MQKDLRQQLIGLGFRPGYHWGPIPTRLQPAVAVPSLLPLSTAAASHMEVPGRIQGWDIDLCGGESWEQHVHTRMQGGGARSRRNEEG